MYNFVHFQTAKIVHIHFNIYTVSDLVHFIEAFLFYLLTLFNYFLVKLHYLMYMIK